METKGLASAISKRRKKLNISQAKLSGLCSVSRLTLRAIENGQDCLVSTVERIDSVLTGLEEKKFQSRRK